MYAYRPPSETNKKVFFDELNETLNNVVNKYDVIFIAGDLNMDTGDQAKDTNNYLDDFMHSFSLNNLLKLKLCYKSATSTILHIMLINKLRSLQKTSTVTSRIRDRQKMIVIRLKLPPKKIVYRDHKNFNKRTFLYDLDGPLIQEKL